MKVKIISIEKSTYWYAGCLGQTFEVADNSDPYSPNYTVTSIENGKYRHDIGRYLLKTDCQILSECDMDEYVGDEEATEYMKIIFGDMVYYINAKSQKELELNHLDLLRVSDVCIDLNENSFVKLRISIEDMTDNFMGIKK